MRTGTCRHCGRLVTLVKTGVVTWKWLVDADDGDSWKCPAPGYPVRAHDVEHGEEGEGA